MATNADARPEHLLIDGYNVIKAVPRFRRRERISLESARQALAQSLLIYTQRTGARITLFFDGDEGLEPALETAQQDDVQVLFSRPPEKADDLMKRAIQQKHGARRVRAISSDREIRRFAEKHKIRTTASAEFAAELERTPSQPAARPTPREFDPHLVLDEEEVRAWEELFREGCGEE